jgi:hypothetical protein
MGRILRTSEILSDREATNHGKEAAETTEHGLLRVQAPERIILKAVVNLVAKGEEMVKKGNDTLQLTSVP